MRKRFTQGFGCTFTHIGNYSFKIESYTNKKIAYALKSILKHSRK